MTARIGCWLEEISTCEICMSSRNAHCNVWRLSGSICSLLAITALFISNKVPKNYEYTCPNPILISYKMMKLFLFFLHPTQPEQTIVSPSVQDTDNGDVIGGDINLGLGDTKSDTAGEGTGGGDTNLGL